MSSALCLEEPALLISRFLHRCFRRRRLGREPARGWLDASRSHKSEGGIGRHRNGHGRVPTVFWALEQRAGTTATDRLSLDPDEWLVRVRSATREPRSTPISMRTRMRMTLEQQRHQCQTTAACGSLFYCLLTRGLLMSATPRVFRFVGLEIP